MKKILHLDLKPVEGDCVQLRYFQDNSASFDPHPFPLGEIKELVENADTYYYTRIETEDPAKKTENLVKIGKRLYNWLDTDDRYLEENLKDLGNRDIILAITTVKELAHLPWEVLHNGNDFLVNNSIVPVRWLSSNSSKNKLSIAPLDKENKNRALQVLFMASSPIDVEPALDYEAEEARIIEATKETREPENSLNLIVEESGSLSGLGDVINPKDPGTFDILHLTGHATIKNGKPFFITEDEKGEACNTSPSDITDQLYEVPELIFLSACHTGQAIKSGTVPSMAEEFLRRSSVKAILSWGNTVLDTDATQAAKVLYQELSQGKQVAQAVAKTYKALIKDNARDWHLLRLYTGDTLPGALVTSWNTPERKPKAAPLRSVATRLFDPKGDRKVPTPETFVGRRRQLQKCFNELIYKEGVLIHGMGGLGKSSLALRLCDRYSNKELVFWKGRVDEDSLAQNLKEKLEDPERRKMIENPEEELKYRLRSLFKWRFDNNNKNFLLVLDDFEDNLEFRDDNYVLTLEAVSVLRAIVWAIKETHSMNRIIITCRHDFRFSESQSFYKQPLDALRGADLQKKWNRLTASDKEFQKDENLRSQVEKLADGNHRLLEELYEELKKTSIDKTSVLSHLEAKLPELLQQVFEPKLLDQIKKDSLMQDILQRGLIFESPVPKEALKAVCETIPKLDVDKLDEYIDKAVKLGVLGVSHDKLLRVHRYLSLNKSDEISVNKEAAKVLNRLWYEPAETKTKIPEERLLEIHRLAKLANETEIIVEMTETLATRCKNRSLFEKLIKLCMETLEYLEKVNCDVHNNQVARIKNFLAHSNVLLGYYKKAESLYEEALKIREKHSESEEKSFDLAKTLDGLGYLYSLIGEYDKSKDMLEKALNIINKKTQEELFNKEQDWRREEKLPIKVQCLSHLAYWHREQRNWEKARFLYVKALWMCKRLPGEEKITLAESYHNLATVYYEQDAYKKAEAWYLKALKLSQKLPEEEHLTIANILTSLAEVYFLQKRYEDAQSLFCKALNIKIKLLENHSQIAHILCYLGDINYHFLKNYKESKKWYSQALEMLKILIKKKHPSINNKDYEMIQELKSKLDNRNLADV